MDNFKPEQSYFAHETSVVSPKAHIGEGVQIWVGTQVREGAVIGDESTLSYGVYIDKDVEIGARVKIQNNVSVYHGVKIEDGVFVGPHVVFTNDKHPRAIDKDGNKLSDGEWEVAETLVEYGASIGANASIRAGIIIGRWAMVGMGAVVTKNVPEYGLVMGNPAELRGTVDEKGNIIQRFNK